jgi:hypothetical protein
MAQYLREHFTGGCLVFYDDDAFHLSDANTGQGGLAGTGRVISISARGRFSLELFASSAGAFAGI